MAEYLLKYLAPKELNLHVESCGVMAVDGQKASTNSIIACKDDKIDISPHRSKTLRPSQLRDCDLILTMEKSHKNEIKTFMPDIKEKLFCLTEFGNKNKYSDISDPIGKD